jgi:hypothetical protein
MNGDVLVDPYTILNGWKNYFCQVLNVQYTGWVVRVD